MMMVVIGSASAVIVAMAIVIALVVRGRKRPERHRKTMLIGAALPFVPVREPAFVVPPSPPVTEPVTVPAIEIAHEPLDDDGPTTADPRRAQFLAVPEPLATYPRRLPRASSAPIEGPTIRGPGIPPQRSEPARTRDAQVRAAIRANTLQVTIKPRR